MNDQYQPQSPFQLVQLYLNNISNFNCPDHNLPLIPDFNDPDIVTMSCPLNKIEDKFWVSSFLYLSKNYINVFQCKPSNFYANIILNNSYANVEIFPHNTIHQLPQYLHSNLIHLLSKIHNLKLFA